MLRPLVHYGIHFLVPIAIAMILFKSRRWNVLLIFLGVMLIDLDHLLATPLFDPNRCSIGYHPLHTLPAILLYAALLFIPKLRILSLALLLHITADATDCWLMKLGL